MLARLATITDSVWFDPAWDDGAFTEDDGGTLRITSLLSRDLGWTQYTVAGASLPQSPAVAASPNNKRIMSFAGVQYMAGAAALAALLQGSAAYSEVAIASRAVSATMVRWSTCHSASSARVLHYVQAGDNTNRLMRAIADGSNTVHVGSAVTVTTPHLFSATYTAADYDAWLDQVSETLTFGGANTRAPVVLDGLFLGAQAPSGTPVSFWNGTLEGLVITPGTVLATPDRTAIEADLAAYYGH